MNRSADLFLSHSSADADLVGELRNALEAAGFSCWMAPVDISGGSSWAEQIAAAVEGCQALVVVLSERAAVSEHVAREVSLAVHHDRPILPVRLAAVPLSGSLAYLLQLVQWVDLFPGAPRARFPAVVAGAATLLGREAADPGPPAVPPVPQGPAFAAPSTDGTSAAPARPDRHRGLVALAAAGGAALLLGAVVVASLGSRGGGPTPSPAASMAGTSGAVPPIAGTVRLAWLERSAPDGVGAGACDYPPLEPPDAVIHVADATGGTLRQLTELHGCDPALSPDGRLLAWTDHEGLHVTDLADGTSARVTLDPALAEIAAPAWAPDAGPGPRRLAFVAADGEQLAALRTVTITPAPGATELAPASTCAWAPLSGPASAPAWSADGARIAFTAQPNLLLVTDAACGTTPDVVMDALDVPAALLYEAPAWLRPTELLLTGRAGEGDRAAPPCGRSCLVSVDLRDAAPIPAVAVAQDGVAILQGRVSPDCPVAGAPSSSAGPSSGAPPEMSPASVSAAPPCGLASLLAYAADGPAGSSIEVRRAETAAALTLVTAAPPLEVRQPSAVVLR